MHVRFGHISFLMGLFHASQLMGCLAHRLVELVFRNDDSLLQSSRVHCVLFHEMYEIVCHYGSSFGCMTLARNYPFNPLHSHSSSEFGIALFTRIQCVGLSRINIVSSGDRKVSDLDS